MSDNKIPPQSGSWIGIRFTRQTTGVDAEARPTQTGNTFEIGTVPIVAIISAITLAAIPLDKLVALGSILSSIFGPRPAANAPQKSIVFATFFLNSSKSPVDVTRSLQKLQSLRWADNNGNALTAEAFLVATQTTSADLGTLRGFTEEVKATLPDALTKQTLLALNSSVKTDWSSDMADLLAKVGATSTGDYTGSSSPDPADAWGKGLINRLTTGGPNGSMAGGIAVKFMSTVPVPGNNLGGVFDVIMKVVKTAVGSAAQSAAEGLADYLMPKFSGQLDKKTATIVKGINDSMPSTGKTIAQLAVFNALGDPEIQRLDVHDQLRAAYTVANATRAAVEATGRHVADLVQANDLPNEQELRAAQLGGFLDFLKSVGQTVASGVMQAAPVILNAVVSSMSAKNALKMYLPDALGSANGVLEGVQQLDTAGKIALASRVVNGKTNPDSTVVSDKAVQDIASRASSLASQAALDTFNETPAPGMDDDEKAKKFRDVALAVATLSPTLSNVTDIGATDLVTDDTLNHADSLRQNALEVGMRSAANMIADNPAARMLHSLHVYRATSNLKAGEQPQNLKSFSDFLNSVIPIAANIAKTAVPALLSIL